MSAHDLLLRAVSMRVRQWASSHDTSDFVVSVYVSDSFYYDLAMTCPWSEFVGDSDGTARFCGYLIWRVSHPSHPDFKILVEEK